ncbi:unnamed protein product [Clonostachys rosea]|uniref:Uncharacterized protein n=1 Tax=Bionectria ochroleuca TaxID=29856 RepID=A0ABY6UXZ1_BIOOC|nr:unnamed protein product [Clonostachys rosea]
MKIVKKLSGWLQEWSFNTATRRKHALRKWKKETEASILLLEREFDPLIARAIFNERHGSALYKLPDDVCADGFVDFYNRANFVVIAFYQPSDMVFPIARTEEICFSNPKAL